MDGIFNDCKSASWNSLVSAGVAVVENGHLIKVKGSLMGRLVVAEGITAVSREAFADCMYLEDIILPDSCVSIGDLAFKGCKRLQRFKLPRNVREIGRVIFFKCPELHKIVVDERNTFYEDGDSINAIVSKATGALVAGCFTTQIGENVISVGEGAFNGCRNLTDIYVPGNVNHIGPYAFGSCMNLEDVTIEGDFVVIDSGAFAKCTNLSEVLLGSHVQYAGNAFEPTTRIVTIDRSVRKRDFGDSIPEITGFY